MGHGITPFQDNPFVEIGRLIHEESYQREKKEVDAGNMKFDIIKKRDGKVIVAEVKKSSRFIDSATMQLVFYLYNLKKQGISAEGELLVPREKKRIKVELTEDNIKKIENAISEIREITNRDIPPPVVKNRYCRRCAFSDFCWA